MKELRKTCFGENAEGKLMRVFDIIVNAEGAVLETKFHGMLVKIKYPELKAQIDRMCKDLEKLNSAS